MTEVYITSAFSIQNTGGNEAGVVLRAEAYTEKQKTALAARLGLSETAFLSGSEYADYKIEYFTPKKEVPMCGHATIAAFAALCDLGMAGSGSYSIETKSGILKIEIAEDGMIFMQQNCPVFGRQLEPSVLEMCLPSGISDNRFPVQIVSTGLRDILFPVASAEQLKEAVPVYEAMAEISRQQNVIGVHAFSLINTPPLTAVCRNFAPLYGILEESATGTSNCALACYLFRYGIRKKQYVFEQGHNLGSISRITVRLESNNDTITKVMAGGYGYVKDKLHEEIR